MTGQRDRPDVAAIYHHYSAAVAQYGVIQATHVGEATFECERDGRPVIGYAYALTTYTGGPAGPAGVWSAADLLLYASSPDRVAMAASVAQHAFATRRINPQWAAMQRHTRQVGAEIESKSRREIADIIGSAYAARSAAQERTGQQHSLAIRGLESVADPATGRTLQVDSGSNYYWIDPAGTIVGTQSRSQPGIDFTELIKIR